MKMIQRLLQSSSQEKKPTRIKTIEGRQSPKIAIIGAGAAGLACAMQLLKYGFKDVIILEAQDRIGGRINTVPFGDNVVDMGAQWCYGEKGNAVYTTVRDFDVLETTDDDFFMFESIRSNGQIVPADTVAVLKKIILDIFEKSENDSTQTITSMGRFLTSEYYSRVRIHPRADAIVKEIREEFFENYLKFESSETSKNLNYVSTAGYKTCRECGGGKLLNWKDKGNIEFLRILTNAKDGGHQAGVLESRILYNRNVEKISWDCKDGCVRVYMKGRDKHITADHVVVTVSVGVLKRRMFTLFQPALPKSRRDIIRYFGYGYVCKIYVEFLEPFWPSEWPGFCALWRHGDVNRMRNTPREWIVNIVGFFRVKYQPRVLVALVVGDFVTNVESLSKEILKSDIVFMLSRFLRNWEITEPVNVIASDWGVNPFFQGAYTYFSMKMAYKGVFPHSLAQPLTQLVYDPKYNDSAMPLTDRPTLVQPIVLFAGEGTSDHYFSTVHGAVESGWREAQRLAKYYNRESK